LQLIVFGAACGATAAFCASAGFQHLYKVSEGVFTERCHVCRMLIKHKQSPKQHTLCYANSTWQEHNAREVLQATAKVLESLPASSAT
jgi:6-phosphofructokinase